MSLRCVAADSIYANNANRKFSMQYVYIVDYQQYSTLKGTTEQVGKYLRMCKLVIFSTILGLYLHFGK